MEQKTFEEICIEQALAYGRKDYRQDFEIGAGLSKLMSEEQFFSRCAEIYANHKSAIVKEEMKFKIDKQIEGTAESVSYAIANREEELGAEHEILKQDIRMLCGLLQDFEWPKHLFETISNIVMNAETHAIS